MTQCMCLYAQHLTAEPAVVLSPDELARAAARAKRIIDDADAVVVGAGSGLSSACGFEHYRRTDAFDERFSRFEDAHGISSLMDGYYHVYGTNEERWAYLAEYIAYMDAAPIGRTYRQLSRLLSGKRHFVLTTNVDGQVRRAFPTESTWLFQGDFGFLQCSQPCCDRLESAPDAVKPIVAGLAGTGIAAAPQDLPRCPECGWLMAPWVRDEGFLEGEAWREGKRRYERFVTSALAECHRVVFFELGVGGMTPSIIELPFWDMVRKNDNAFYLRINVLKASEPRQLGKRSFTVTGDIARVFDLMLGDEPKGAEPGEDAVR